MGASSWVAEPPWAECLSSRSGPGSPCRLRSRSIMMCRCRALAMALESLGRSRSAGMMLLVTPGQWAPDSVTDCQTSGGACREVGAQRNATRRGGSPSAARSPLRSRVSGPASLPDLSLSAGARAGVLGSVPPPLPRSPGANPPTRLLGAFSVACGAPWPLRHIRRSG